MCDFLANEARLYWTAARGVRNAIRRGASGADLMQDLEDMEYHVTHPTICTDIVRLRQTHAGVAAQERRA